MGTMTIRSTYSLDADTARTIKRLAQQWDASQAEVIRRSVRLAAEQAEEAAMSPAEVVAHYRSAPPPRDRDGTRKLVAKLRSQRRSDERKRSARLKPARA